MTQYTVSTIIEEVALIEADDKDDAAEQARFQMEEKYNVPTEQVEVNYVKELK